MIAANRGLSVRLKFTLLGMLLVSGLLLRVAGSEWGFPLLANADEPLVTADASRLAFIGGWEPGVYDHPGHFSIYANSLLYRAVAAASGHPAAGMEYYREHVLVFQRASRLLNAGWSVLLIFVAYLVGREFSEEQGVLAALLMTFFPSFIQHAYYITADVPLTLFVALNAWFCIRYLKTGQTRLLVAAVAAGALALTEKYPGALVTLTIAASVLAYPGRSGRAKARQLVWAAALFLAIAFAAAPYLFLRFDRVLEAVAIEAKPVHLGADGLDPWGNLRFYALQFTLRAGIPLVAATLLGFSIAPGRSGRAALPLYGGLVYLAFISSLGLHWERWALPCFFFFLQAAAFGVTWCVERWGRREFPGRSAVAGVLLVTCLSLILQAVNMAVTFQLPDTRCVALAFCRERGITPENTAYEAYTPFSPALSAGRKPHASRPHTPQSWILSGKRYAMVSSYVTGRYLAEPDRFRTQVAAYRALRSKPLIGLFDSASIVAINTYDLPALPSQAAGGLTAHLEDILTRFACSGPVIEIYDLGSAAKSLKTAHPRPSRRRMLLHS